jgi:hypothetical protein
MVGRQPREGYSTTWRLTATGDDVTLCAIVVAGIGRYVKRDWHKVEDYGGNRCPACWQEWRLRTAASYARQDQWEAGR